MPFPYIVDFESFKNSVGEKNEIRHMTQPNGMIVSCYLVAMESTFDNPYAEECRGTVFDKGQIVSRPLNKFYNLNERDGSRIQDFDWSKVHRVLDKRDGSMISTVSIGEDNFDVKSKKSFSSDVASYARQWISTRANYKFFCRELSKTGCTAIFEWTSPNSRIVLNYKEDELQLLHIRHNQTGEYWKQHELQEICDRFGIKLIESQPHTIQLQAIADRGEDISLKMLSLAETLQGIEGWVIQFNDGRMVKVKTKQYLELHRVLTFLRERDIVLMVLREQLDDLKSTLKEEGVDTSEVIALETRTVMELNEIERQIDVKLQEGHGLDRKSLALKFGPSGENFKYFGLMMKKFTGGIPDIVGWYESHVLPTISLRQLNMINLEGDKE